MKKTLFICLLSTLCLFAAAHSGKVRFHVIIDTDGAADDLRAICMLLADREAEVLAVTTSEGALTPDIAAQKVTSLLHHFHHEGIPVGVGRSLGIESPAWRKQSENINWGEPVVRNAPFISAKEIIINSLENETAPVTLICLGTMTNLNDVLTDRPQLKESIERVIWYGSSAQPPRGSNYEGDKAAADKILSSGLTVEIVSGNEQLPVVIDDDYFKMIEQAGGIYAGKIVDSHNSEALAPVIKSKHIKAWDDLTAVFLFAPDLFVGKQVSPTVSSYNIETRQALEQAKQTIAKILAETDSDSRLFASFPEDSALFDADVAAVMKNLIAKHGRSEWRAGVIANELHGHLGVYAIIGVKMGIRAREYFNIGVDDIVVESYAGSQPPVSCMNDGLQVSVGATIGHGLISIAATSDIRPEASFSFKGKTLRLRLKQEYARQIADDVMECIRRDGNFTKEYWQSIRQLALRYWLQFDRHEIFE
ncbi:MAG: nucleoside hydrolase [Tannerella sp.]|jgi:pyrimidine-specific ribonucleoside hydrolase|nr:nucleoside hydrolase [Tannerella sp.]